ncbi:hypothetical protein A8135_01015 [Legionella jamestowniensis]|uniref:UPF0235 protein A8135_01015 n=1 Tax=Legionella jamestowniensis TaxID=455 RepID=A0ABX2XT95_9GAMM|nr:DUF167 domain-containing protein [Legionella jamestowniensis]OCH97833.1 hypothetical protein A8135_01015 [Legionella jamestowniensis]
MSCPLWLKRSAEQLTLRVKVKPGAKQNKISFNATGGLQISLQASPQEGKANKMLVVYLAKLLRVPQKQISLLHGTTSRNKLIGIKIPTMEQDRLIEILLGISR